MSKKLVGKLNNRPILFVSPAQGKQKVKNSLVLFVDSAINVPPIDTPPADSGQSVPAGGKLSLPDYRIGGHWTLPRYDVTYPLGIVPALNPLAAVGGVVSDQAVQRLSTGEYRVSFTAALDAGAGKMVVTDRANPALTASLYNTYAYADALNLLVRTEFNGFRFYGAGKGNVAISPALPRVRVDNSDGAVTGYFVRDFAGTVVDVGTVQSGYADLLLPALTRCGSYLVSLTGGTVQPGFGSSHGNIIATTVVSVAPPEDETTNLWPLSYDFAGGANVGNQPNQNLAVTAWAGTPARATIYDAASPDIAGLQGFAAVQDRCYVRGKDGGPADPVNPRRQYFNAKDFDANFPAQKAGMTQVVAALAQYGVLDFAGKNEPGGNPDASDLSQLQDLSAAIKAGNPAAHLLAPESVNAWSENVASLYAAGAAAVVDAHSFHAYNLFDAGLNGGITGLAEMFAGLQAAGMGGKPVWMTEQGAPLAQYGVLVPWRAASAFSRQLMAFDRVGIRPEFTAYWYAQASDFSFETWLCNQDGSYNPQALWLRRRTVEGWGQQFASGYDFGAGGNRLWFGNRFDGQGARAGQSVSAFYPNGTRGASLTLAVTGTNIPATLVLADSWGNEQAVPVVNGEAALPAPDASSDGLPRYLRHPTSVTLTPVGTDRGVNLALNAAVTTPSSMTIPSNIATPSNTAQAQFLTDGTGLKIWSSDAHFFSGGGAVDSFLAGDTLYPYTLRIDLGSVQSVSGVIVMTPDLYQSCCGILSADIFTAAVDGGTRTFQGHFGQAANTVEETVNKGTLATFASDYCVMQRTWDLPLLAPLEARYIYLVVNACTPGGQGDMIAAAYGGQPSIDVTQRKSVSAITLSQIEVY